MGMYMGCFCTVYDDWRSWYVLYWICSVLLMVHYTTNEKTLRKMYTLVPIYLWNWLRWLLLGSTALSWVSGWLLGHIKLCEYPYKTQASAYHFPCSTAACQQWIHNPYRSNVCARLTKQAPNFAMVLNARRMAFPAHSSSLYVFWASGGLSHDHIPPYVLQILPDELLTPSTFPWPILFSVSWERSSAPPHNPQSISH